MSAAPKRRGRRVEAGQMPRGLQAVHQRHADVEQDRIRMQARHGLQRGAAVAGLAHDFHISTITQ